MTIINLLSEASNFDEKRDPNSKPFTLIEKQIAENTMKSLYIKKMHRQLNHIMCPCCIKKKNKAKPGKNARGGGGAPIIHGVLDKILGIGRANLSESLSLVDESDDRSAWFEIDGMMDRRREIICPDRECRGSFCGNCFATPYHFKIQCEEVVNYTRAWADWCQRGKREFMAAVASQDENYRRQLAEFDANIKKQVEDRQNFERRMQELQADEQYKAANCRSCPHCGRTVQKLDGCNSMVCGRNYHGGDNQNGCGKNFDWSKAPPYIVNVGSHLTEEEAKNKLALVAPSKAKAHRHKWTFENQVCTHKPKGT
jgi:hypothetical protein